MKDENCIFCKIANGGIPSATLYEDEDFRVILDLGPATRGHALILPKEHYANVIALPEEVTAKAFILAKKMADGAGVTWAPGTLTDETREEILKAFAD